MGRHDIEEHVLKVRAADLDILHVDTGFAQLRQVALDLLSVLRRHLHHPARDARQRHQGWR